MVTSTKNKTYLPKESDIKKNCYLIDANNKILGKVAAKAASILRGKHKTIFTPHLDTGDTVIIINAEKISVSGKKMTDKIYKRYTGYPGGQRSLRLEELLVKAPTQPLRLAINRMLPSGRLGNKLRDHVKIYAGENHPHAAQKPVAINI